MAGVESFRRLAQPRALHVLCRCFSGRPPALEGRWVPDRTVKLGPGLLGTRS